MVRRLVLLGALGIAVAAGCRTGIEPQPPNRPPETRLVAGPPDSTAATSYRVELAWTGSDPDGDALHFEFLLVDHPAAHDSITGDDVNRVVVTVPAPDDPRWRPTVRRDSIFVVRADTLRLDPGTLPPETVRQRFFERWHTFFVRAVDARGLADATPDYRSFNARTLAPIVAFRYPIIEDRQLVCRPDAILEFSGEDPLDKNSVQEPDSSRWALVTRPWYWPSSPPTSERLHAHLAGAPWSAWRAWDAPDDAGRQVRLAELDSLPGTVPGYYIVAVQAMDAAGAVTPVLDPRTPGKNNLAWLWIRTRDQLTPLLTVEDMRFAAARFDHVARPVQFLLGSGQPLQFRWRADASRYASEVTGFRYGWDLPEPWNPTQPWACSFGLGCTSSPPMRFADGMHRLYVQARDRGGGTTTAQIEFEVRPVPRRRDVLLVDDTTQYHGREAVEDARWSRLLVELASAHGFTFDPNRDTYDVADNRDLPPPAEQLFDYRVVVWNVVNAAHGSALSTLGRFVDPFQESQRNLAPRFNDFHVYLDNGGQIWLSGDQPVQSIWPITANRPNPDDQVPADLVHWQDAVASHPEEDSVGVHSIAYRLGVEALDIGGGGRAPRPRRANAAHYCQRLRLAALDLDPELPAVLEPDSLWPLPPPPTNPGFGRPNVEIYNMPSFLAARGLSPPLSRTLYTYVSLVPEDAAGGVIYPLTADGQPSILVAKRLATDARYSRVLCGFETYLLEYESHRALARYILVTEMGLGRAP